MSRLFPLKVTLAIAALLAAFALAPAAAQAGTTGTIEGFVSDAAGHPIAGASVSIVSPTFAGKTTTGSNGFYAVNGLPVDTYRISVTAAGFQPQIVSGVTVVQDQSVRINVAMTAQIHTLATIAVRGQTSIVQATQTADTYTVTQSVFENINGTPQDLNGFMAFNSLPGVTTDNGGYPIIRAGAENDVGYEYEGVDNTDPVTGQFLNGLSLNGTRSIQLSTGGYDVANGNTNSGVINQVIQRGAFPGGGESTIRLQSPLYTHELSFDYGSATPDNRYSWYFSFGGQRDGNGYGDLKSTYPLLLNFDTFTDTDDDVANLYYHFGKNNSNEVQWLTDMTAGDDIFGTFVNPLQEPYATANGNVQIGTQDYIDPNNGSTLPISGSNYITLFPGQGGYDQNVGYIDSQSFNSLIEKLAFKHQITASSFVDVNLHHTMENLIFNYPYDAGSFTDFYENLATEGTGTSFEYDNQLSSEHSIGIGGDYSGFKSMYFAGTPSDEPFFEPLEPCYVNGLNQALNGATIGSGEALPYCLNSSTPLSTYPSDFSYVEDPVDRLDGYVKDLWQPTQRITADVGVRYDEQIYNLPSDVPELNSFYTTDDEGNIITHLGSAVGPDVTRPSQVSPRAALTYKLSDKNVLRFSYGKNIEFEPESGIENLYKVNPALATCTVASGCLTPLQGYSPTCANGVDPQNANAPCNNISNLYQQIIIDQNTNNFAQYTPVLPQRAVNADFSVEHDFGSGYELKITPYYRKGTEYVVGSSTLLFTLPSGSPVFGPSHFSNQGVNENTGVEFDFQREVTTGLSGFLNFTYDNTLANYDSDFFPFANAAALAAGHYFHVSYVAPITGTLNLAYDSPKGWHMSMNMPYESGYPYGVGKKMFVFANQCDPTRPAVPVEVLNTDLAEECGGGTVQDAYYYTDPSNPGTVFSPNITGSRGTPDGDDPGTIRGNPLALITLSISHEIGVGKEEMQAGFRVENLLGNLSGPSPSNNPWYVNQGLGGYYSGGFNASPACDATIFPSGYNVNQCFEPFMYNFGPLPYENESDTATPRVITFFISAKY